MLGLSWDHILVLIAAALFILGPERLPGAAAWLGRTVRQARGMAQRAQQQMRDEMGPEFDELRRPLEDLRRLRSFDPRRAITQHLFDGDPDPLGLAASDDHRSVEAAPRPGRSGPAERPPVDPDAT